MVEYPKRAGVFSEIASAQALIRKLEEHNFSWKDISVLSSDENVKKMFPTPAQQPGSNEHAQTALNTAGVGLLGLGTAALATALVSSTGIGLLAMGIFTGVAAGGTFASVMIGRGFDSEATDFYEQAVEAGKILVVVHVAGDNEEAEERRRLASSLIEEAGAEAIQLAN